MKLDCSEKSQVYEKLASTTVYRYVRPPWGRKPSSKLPSSSTQHAVYRTRLLSTAVWSTQAFRADSSPGRRLGGKAEGEEISLPCKHGGAVARSTRQRIAAATRSVALRLSSPLPSAYRRALQSWKEPPRTGIKARHAFAGHRRQQEAACRMQRVEQPTHVMASDESQSTDTRSPALETR